MANLHPKWHGQPLYGMIRLGSDNREKWQIRQATQGRKHEVEHQIKQGARGWEHKAEQTGKGKMSRKGTGLICGMLDKNVGPHCNKASSRNFSK